MKQVKKKFLIQHYNHLLENNFDNRALKMLRELLEFNFNKYDEDVIDGIGNIWFDMLKGCTNDENVNDVLDRNVEESQAFYTKFDENSIHILNEIVRKKFDYEDFVIVDLLKNGVILQKFDTNENVPFESEYKVFSYDELLNDFKFYKTDMPCGKL